MTTARKSIVFRATGLPGDQPEEECVKWFDRAICTYLSEEERQGFEFKLIPSCYEDGLTRVALVEFKCGIPKFLSELAVDPLGEWQVEAEDVDITFDCHFFGFTQLYVTPPAEEITAEYVPENPLSKLYSVNHPISSIIAITGLDGHAYGSWRGRGNLGRMWLRDFLSKDLPRCRAMTYGYNSKLSSYGINTVSDYSREFLEEMKQVRSLEEVRSDETCFCKRNSSEIYTMTQERQRPLIFIAHSFGGIILAHVCLSP